MHIEARAKTLQEHIEVAFADVPKPSRESMVQSECLDQRWCAEQLAGRPREEVTVTDALTDCLLHMPLPAVHYYFPMFLLYPLASEHRRESFVLLSLIQYLDRRNRHEYPPFSSTQKQCIIEWLELVWKSMEAYDFWGYGDRYERRLRVIRD
jgi:hypothetical protein